MKWSISGSPTSAPSDLTCIRKTLTWLTLLSLPSVLIQHNESKLCVKSPWPIRSPGGEGGRGIRVCGEIREEFVFAEMSLWARSNRPKHPFVAETEFGVDLLYMLSAVKLLLLGIGAMLKKNELNWIEFEMFHCSAFYFGRSWNFFHIRFHNRLTISGLCGNLWTARVCYVCAIKDEIYKAERQSLDLRETFQNNHPVKSRFYEWIFSKKCKSATTWKPPCRKLRLTRTWTDDLWGSHVNLSVE